MTKHLPFTSWLDSPSPPQTPAPAKPRTALNAANLPPRIDSLQAAQAAAQRQENVRLYTLRQQQQHGPKGNLKSRFSMDTEVPIPSNKDYGPGGKPLLWARIVIRFLQFVLAVTVAGLYGQDIHMAAQYHQAQASAWVYAVVVAGMSAVTVMIYVAPIVKTHFFWFWDLLLFILWVAVFGRFASQYLHYKPALVNGKVDTNPGPSPNTMHHAVWVDMINMVLWFLTGTYGAVLFFTARKRSLHTGRAKV
jgi:hypothetical protein